MASRSDKLFVKRRKAKEELARSAASRIPRRRVLIVTEGEVTEVEYFEALRSSLKLVSVDLDICGKECDSSPTAVVRYALHRAEAEGTYKRGGYNDVYCVFDRDTHQDFEKALSQILNANKPRSGFKGETITAVPSYPCFEFWLLLHFIYSRAPFVAAGRKSVAQVVESELKKYSPFENFDKSLTNEMAQALQAKTVIAIEHAEMVMEDVEKTGNVNPSTKVHLLVKALYDLRGDN